MELWIRSQLKGSLTKVNDLRIMQLDKDGFRVLIEEDAKEGWCIIANDDPCIGTYKTKERALEVLDEIHNRIATLTAIDLMGVNDTNLKVFNKYLKENPCSVVYEMPKE